MIDVENTHPRLFGAEARTDLVDPCTGAVVGSAPDSTADEVDQAVHAARASAPAWAAATPAHRQRALLRLADALEASAEDYVLAESALTGKPLLPTREEEVLAAVDHLRFFAGLARLHDGAGAAEYLAGHTSYVRREPVGVTGHLLPSNYPLLMAVWHAAPSLAAGNTAVLKPAEATPRTAAMLAAHAAGTLGPDVLSVVCGGAAAGQRLIAGVDVIALTGTTATGARVAATAASCGVRTHLELGGNAPALVFPDVDPTAVAGQLAEAAFFNAGQDCTAVTRVLAHESIAPALTTALVAAARATRPGPPSDPEAFSGPLITRAHLSRTADVLDRLPSRIEVVAGGAPLPGPGFFFAPTVLLGARQSDEVVQRELFAPVVTVQTFGTEDKAVLLANGVRQALTASVWTADHARAHRLVPRLRAGCVWVNAHMRFAAEMPHGGPGASGHGRDLSRYAVDDYTSLKHVMHRFDDR